MCYNVLQQKSFLSTEMGRVQGWDDEPSHRDLHCLAFRFDFCLASLFATMNMSKFNNGNVHFINSGWEGLSLVLCVLGTYTDKRKKRNESKLTMTEK